LRQGRDGAATGGAGELGADASPTRPYLMH